MPRKIKRKPRKRETNIYDVLIHAVTKLTWLLAALLVAHAAD